MNNRQLSWTRKYNNNHLIIASRAYFQQLLSNDVLPSYDVWVDFRCPIGDWWIAMIGLIYCGYVAILWCPSYERACGSHHRVSCMLIGLCIGGQEWQKLQPSIEIDAYGIEGDQYILMLWLGFTLMNISSCGCLLIVPIIGAYNSK